MDFILETPNQDRPINLLEIDKDTVNTLKEGDAVWLAVAKINRKNTGFDIDVKPFLVKIKTIHVNRDNFFGIEVDLSDTKHSHRYSIKHFSNNFRGFILTRQKSECEHFYDQRVIEIANQIGRKSFEKKQNALKKLIRTPKPIDQELNDALTWKDTLGGTELNHIKKLIEMSKSV